MIGRLVSFWDGLVSGAMLVSGRVSTTSTSFRWILLVAVIFFQLFGRRLDGEVLAVPVSSRPRRFGGRFQMSLVEQTELVCYTWVEKIFEKCYVIIDYRYHIVISSYVYT